MMMKLAGFYGLTAPQLILLYDSFGIEKIEKLGSKLINAVDRVNIINAKNELYYLNASLDQIDFVYTKPFTITFSDSENAALVNKGSIANFTGDANELMTKVFQQLTLDTVEILLLPKNASKIDSSKFGDLSSKSIKSSISSVVKSCISSRAFNVKDISIIAKSCARRFLGTPGCTYNSVSRDISAAYEFKQYCPETFSVDGKDLTLSSAALKLLMYFLDNKNKIHLIDEKLNPDLGGSFTIFDIPFIDFLNRNPRILPNLVLQRFKTLQGTQKAHFVEKVCSDIAEQLILLNRLLDENVITVEGRKNVYGLNYSEALEIAKECQDREYFSNLLNSKILIPENLDKGTFTDIISVHKLIKNLQANSLNSRFDENLSYSDWEDVFMQLNAIGICGLHFYVEEVFTEFLGSTTLNLYSKVVLKEDVVQKIRFYIGEVESLLESLRPIGGAVDEKLVHL